MSQVLFDREIAFYRYGCTDESGAFDPAKAAELGFSEAQYPAIIAVLSDQPSEQSATEETADTDD